VTPFKNYYQTQTSVLSHVSSPRCLVTASNSGRSCHSGLTTSQAGGQLTPASYSSNCCLSTLDSTRTVLLCAYKAVAQQWTCLQSRSLATAVCWFHSSCFEETCHNINALRVCKIQSVLSMFRQAVQVGTSALCMPMFWPQKESLIITDLRAA
jgi:hypothetical protein